MFLQSLHGSLYAMLFCRSAGILLFDLERYKYLSFAYTGHSIPKCLLIC